VFVPFQPGRRESGKSKFNVTALFNFAVNGVCSFSNFPLRLCIGLGFCFAAFSIISAFAQVAIYLFGSREVPGWASIFTIVSFFTGFQLFFLGVMGEYISLIFDEVKRRPRYLVDRHHLQNAVVAPQSSYSTDRSGKNDDTLPTGDSSPLAPTIGR
jgi:polyisoprenyl-phosphate glycosyltransferase